MEQNKLNLEPIFQLHFHLLSGQVLARLQHLFPTITDEFYIANFAMKFLPNNRVFFFCVNVEILPTSRRLQKGWTRERSVIDNVYGYELLHLG